MMPRQKIRETVLYFSPEKKEYETKLKGVLVRMGIRIRVVTPEQTGETVGGLLGFSGWSADGEAGKEQGENQPGPITEEVLVMHNFTSRRMDELFLNLRRAGVPRIALKAVVTETNSRWSFFKLYEEIRQEHETMTKGQGGE